MTRNLVFDPDVSESRSDDNHEDDIEGARQSISTRLSRGLTSFSLKEIPKPNVPRNLDACLADSTGTSGARGDTVRFLTLPAKERRDEMRLPDSRNDRDRTHEMTSLSVYAGDHLWRMSRSREPGRSSSPGVGKATAGGLKGYLRGNVTYRGMSPPSRTVMGAPGEVTRKQGEATLSGGNTVKPSVSDRRVWTSTIMRFIVRLSPEND
eukprot:Plantae.Rhodophyta-Rhodochaete_pulchella.ctg37671.p2 GENE.Plantae.Rhodophyta-Rhodochaete_pulchella.ctg37671~~Plantae.Rhodophyta-Rhodochaete_pulchella.ctg37671.p2  ORF type:complete len:208 (+),score=11.17 Plantae.Rhodophyta-Rhodochaete_pulchella.ctg37671:1101-1724(+)